MKFCTNCGTKLEEGAKFCPECGAAVEGTSQDASQADQEFATPQYTTPTYADEPAPAQPQQPAADQGQPYQQPYSYAQPGSQPYQQMAPQATVDTGDHKGYCVVAYLLGWLGCLISYFGTRKEPRSHFVTTHLNSAYYLAITEVVATVLGNVLGKDAFGNTTVLGSVLDLVDLVVFVLAIIGIVHVAQGKDDPAPLTGSLPPLVK